jgi:hypothetical protein
MGVVLKLYTRSSFQNTRLVLIHRKANGMLLSIIVWCFGSIKLLSV